MIAYRSGDVLLANLLFIDGSGAKLRPILALLDVGDSDVIVVPNTAQGAHSRFELTLQEWQQAGLLQPSVVRLHKVTTIEKRVVVRTLDALSPQDWTHVRAKVRQLWATI